jgi:hypothetical protein
MNTPKACQSDDAHSPSAVDERFGDLALAEVYA